jgi:pSer/pThr/pTyr-binding forkhead associated (FHA) protein
MKLSLVVAQGVHTGKVIPIGTIQFLIGRDPHCNLRPASPAVSKQHCGIFVRGDKVVLKDYGSTNGTCVNGEQVADELEISDGDKVKIGPLEFVVKVELAASHSSTVNAAPKKSGVVVPAATVAVAAAPSTLPSAPHVVMGEESDQAAAMLLSMDDGSATDPTAEASIPDGTTVMDIPAADVKAKADAAQKVKQGQADTSKAAADLLSKYMRRPRT